MPFLQTLEQGANTFANAVGALLGKDNELRRQDVADDHQFWQPMVCFFELKCPAKTPFASSSPIALPQVSYLFPLAYAPQAYSLTEPFALDVVKAVDSSLWTDEGGIIERYLRIAGTMGFAPHDLNLPAPVPVNASTLPKNYTDRNLQRAVTVALSGQKHHQYLIDTVFRAYSDLKKDANTAFQTTLIFHNPQDGEHWEVKPRSVSTSRSAASPLTFSYDLDLLVVGPAKPASLPPPKTDTGFIAGLKNAIASVSNAASTIRGAIQDITATVGSFRILGQQVVGILQQADYIVQACDQLVNGTAALLNLPMAAVSQFFGLIESTVKLFVDTRAIGNQLADWPEVIVQRFRAMQQACDQLLAHPEVFTPPITSRLTSLNTQGETQASGYNVVAASSFDDIRRLGSANLPGEVALANAGYNASPARPTYRSTLTIQIRQGDTLAGLAARYLGSASLYRDIAVLNNLSPPLVAADGTTASTLADAAYNTGVLGVGQVILIPSTQAPQQALANAGVLGATAEDPVATQLLGRDLALQAVGVVAGTPSFDLVAVKDAEGYDDIGTVEGTDNLQQSLTSQLTQTKGASPLYPQVGLDSFIGSGLYQADRDMLNYRLTQAILEVPGIQGLEGFAVSYQGTGVFIEAQASVVGVSSTVALAVAL